MKTIIWSLVLLSAASAASAQGTILESNTDAAIQHILQVQKAVDEVLKQRATGGIPVTDVAGPASSTTSNVQSALLNDIHQELVALKLTSQQDRAATATPARVCHYEDKSYSEGAILPVGSAELTCVEHGRVGHRHGETRELAWVSRHSTTNRDKHGASSK